MLFQTSVMTFQTSVMTFQTSMMKIQTSVMRIQTFITKVQTFVTLMSHAVFFSLRLQIFRHEARGIISENRKVMREEFALFFTLSS